MEYQKYIKNYEEKGKEEGITRSDYYNLLNCHKQLRNELYNPYNSKQSSEELKNALEELDNLIYKLHYTFKDKMNSENIDYIMSQSIISGIVFANRESDIIRPYSSDSYMYLCNFHKENTPSLGVSDNRNLFHCFGCGQGGNIFVYLMEYENIGFLESVYLLSAINGIEIPDNKYNANSERVKKYRSALTSVEYLNVLKKALDRNINKNIKTIFNSLIHEHQSIEEYFNNKFEFIERIKKGLNDEKFVFTPMRERLFLEKEESEEIIIPVKKLERTNIDRYITEYDWPF